MGLTSAFRQKVSHREGVGQQLPERDLVEKWGSEKFFPQPDLRMTLAQDTPDRICHACWRNWIKIANG